MKTQSTTPFRAPSRYSLILAAAAAGLLPVAADPVTILNPGFESRQQTADGVDTFNRTDLDFWRHWQRTENGGPLRIWNPGAPGAAPQGVLTEGFGGNAAEGNNVILVYSRYTNVATKIPPDTDGVNYFSAAAQLLTENFDPTKIYTLTAKVGKPSRPFSAANPAGPRVPSTVDWQGYAVQLAVGGTNQPGATFANRVDGGTVIAQDANSVAMAVDEYGNAKITYFPNPANAGLAGLPLQVRLCALEDPSFLAYTGFAVFDDVKLDAYAAPALAYWDLDDTTPGAGGSTPSGTWDLTNKWNAVADGSGATSPWVAGQTAVFSAGADATGSYAVTVVATQDIGGLIFEDGAVTLTGGTALRMTTSSAVDVAAGLTATIETPISEDVAGRELGKTGAGTLVLSGAGTYTGGSSILAGTLRLGAGNVLPDGANVTVASIAEGVTTLDLNGNSDTIGSLTLGGATTTSQSVVTTGAGTLTLGGDVAYVNAFGNGGNPLAATISGNLNLGAAARTFTVNDSATTPDDLTVSADISGSVLLTKTGLGTLVLSGNNAAATGGMVLGQGATRFDSAASINGTARDVSIDFPGTAAFGPSFGAANIPTALLERIATTSTGVIAVDNYASTNFDLNTAGLTNATLGALADTTYTGTLTANGSIYRLGGGGGTLTVPGTNALTGGSSMIVSGKVTLPAANDYSGGTTLLGGTVFPGGAVILALGNDGSLGSGPLTLQGQFTATTTGVIQSMDDSARTLANSLVFAGNLNTGGTGDIAFSDTSVTDLVATRTFTINNPVTTFAQNFSGTGFGITKAGAGTMVLTGNSTYDGTTTVSAGTLIIGTSSAVGTGTLSLGNGAIDTINGPITLSTNNPITFNGNFSFGGTNNLNLGNGAITNGQNRTITLNGTNSTLTFGGAMTNNFNNNQTTTVNGAGNTLVLGGYALAQVNATNRTCTFAGAADLTITGPVTNGLSTASNLVKGGAGTLTLLGDNTYSGTTTVNAGCALALIGGSQESAITVAPGAFLGLSPGSPTTSTKALTLQADAKIRIIGTPTLASHTLFTTSATITGTPELETAIPGYELVLETGNTLKLVATTDPDYLAWSENFLPAVIGLPGDDFDGDGLTNDQERLFGLIPTNPASVNPISVPLDPEAGTFSFTRRDPALTGYDYAVFTSTDLQLWEEDTGAVLTPGAVVDQIQSVAVQLSGELLDEPKLFVRMRAGEAPPPPPLLSVDFEADNGGFTTSMVAGTDWAWGAPTSTGPGGTVNTGNSGSANCWGTNIGNPGYYVNPTTDSRLISPVINLNGVVGAQLSFAYAIDIPTGDSVVVRIFNADTNAEIVAGAFPLTLTDANELAALWQNSGPHALPDGVPTDLSIRIVWSLTGSGGLNADYIGLYIDDVVVGVP